MSTASHSTLDDVRLISLRTMGNAVDGILAVSQCGQDVPFIADRLFTVSAPARAVRGHHAHRALQQFLICVHGTIDVVVDDGATRRSFCLNHPSQALYVPAGIWGEQTYVENGSVLAVLCDAPYDEADYIRDRDEFLAFKSAPQEISVTSDPIRLNLGCGGRPLPGYVNVDQDTLDDLRRRYPTQTFDDSLVVKQYDVFNLPYADASVDEVRADSFIEHLSFADEPRFFHEVTRVLRPGGQLVLSVPDFEEVVRLWLAAKDDWRDFYRCDEEAIKAQHWFGTYSYGTDNRWGYLSAILYGSQNGAGQFHTNCYSEGKLRAIAARIGLDVQEVSRFRWKGDRDPMLSLIAVKPMNTGA